MSTADLATASLHLTAAKYFLYASFIMVVYDHALTFSQEVERIWKQKFTGATFLFFIVRYMSPLEAIVLIVAFNDPKWINIGVATLALVGVGELILILRVYALYRRNQYLLIFLMALWAFQIAMSVVNLSGPTAALHLPPSFVGCILGGKGSFPWIWVAPLITDTCICTLTILKTGKSVISSGRYTKASHILFRDGIMYFIVIFAANLLNILIYFNAVADIKVIGATFSQLITTLMICRLVLNLRSLSTKDSIPVHHRTHSIPLFVERAIGNLGEEIELSPDSEDSGCSH